MTVKAAMAASGTSAMHIKTCGLKDRETVDVALERGASHVGFVHFTRSPRHLEVAEIAPLRAHVGGRALVAVVLVDPDDRLLDALAEAVRPDILQLHGRETPERTAEIAARYPAAVMKALSVGVAADLDAIARYENVADRILLDAKKPKGSELPGGNGIAFDWRLLGDLSARADFMLSGGIHAGNVGEAIASVRPGGLDVSSGIESAPGVKDAALIHAFFDAVEAARLAQPTPPRPGRLTVGPVAASPAAPGIVKAGARR
ncbi:phosphoribosylanthranilate isomerase [Aurantimonas sp. MSK8Z-1]|uniref:phosphoribosylanthranilate isomerase n=1 Tax=Mangrovibrevibacter kandeliae TaxID=2968473 RepID=UPI002118B6A1|nr:phosphoribosylanthranilate isomerase [Aurantimonas sp. MSK8Z-1]MCW4115118.1 phosphoribosylanthranilate isomerase [Aurantimonas sp. MSK8Z-1]